MAPQPSEAGSELHQFAFEKIAKVLGPDRARQIMARLLAELGIELQTPDDLLRLSRAMTALGGFEGAVGGMLGVAAVLRGAADTARDRASAL